MIPVQQAIAFSDNVDIVNREALERIAKTLAAEVRRLREENERLRENAKIIYELEQLAARSNNELLVENERLHAYLLELNDCSCQCYCCRAKTRKARALLQSLQPATTETKENKDEEIRTRSSPESCTRGACTV